jgi:hypothetical protein
VSPRFHTHTNICGDASSPAPLHIFQSPQKRSFLPGSPTKLLQRERCSISTGLSTYLSKSPGKKPPSRFPLRSPYIQKGAPHPEPSLHISRSSQKRNPHPSRFPLRSLYIEKGLPNFPEKEPPSRFPSQSPIETDAPFPEPSSTCLSKTPVKKPPLQVHHQGRYGER